MLELKATKRRELRALAHHLDPVVSIAGNGLTEGVLKEIDVALGAHELIKIRVYGDDRDARIAYLQTICSQLGCTAVQSIGKLLVVYRARPAEAIEEAPVTKKPGRGKPRRPVAARNTAEQRPGRPTTHKPPRVGLRGTPTTVRYRKAPLGSGKPRKSER